MMRAVLLLALLPSAGASARSVPVALPVVSTVALELVAAPALRQDTAPPREPPRPPPPRPRRRPSMVGYVADATIGSQVRIRFDVAAGMDVPDRAEFFYAKCGCYRDLDPDPAFDPDAPGPGPGIVTDLTFRQLYLQAEYAPTPGFSVFAELPTRWLQPQSFAPDAGSFGNQAGIADLRAGIKVAVRQVADQLVTLQLQAAAPTGESERGLGTDHWSLEPALLLHQSIAERLTVEGQVGAVVPVDGSRGVPTHDSESFAGTVLYYGIGSGVELYGNESVRLAPILELVGWHVLNGFQTAPGEDASAGGINIVNVKLGARLLFGDQHSVYVGFGTALTEQVWYQNIFRVEYRQGV